MGREEGAGEQQGRGLGTALGSLLSGENGSGEICAPGIDSALARSRGGFGWLLQERCQPRLGSLPPGTWCQHPAWGDPAQSPPGEGIATNPPLSPPSPRCSPPGGCTPHPAATLPAPAHRSQIWTWHLAAPNFQQKPPVPSCGCRPHCSRAAGRIQPCEKGRKGFGVACCLAPSCSGDGEQLPLPRHTAWGHGYPPQGSPTGSRDMRQLLQHSQPGAFPKSLGKIPRSQPTGCTRSTQAQQGPPGTPRICAFI